MNNPDSSSALRPVVFLGCGHVPRRAARDLLAAGRPVHALVRTEASAAALRDAGFAGAVAADIAGEDWQDLLPATGADVVFAVSGGGDLAGYRRTYRDGMVAALRFAASARTFVYTSSTGVYSQTGGVTVDEDSPVGGDPKSDILAETETLLLRAAAPARRFVLRFGGLYGPGRHYMLDALRRGETTFAGRGDFRINYLHRDDAASAILAALNAPQHLAGGVYNVTDGHPVTKSDIAAHLAQRLGLPPPGFDPEVRTARADRRGSASPDRIVDARKVTRDLGWSPRFPDFRAGYDAILSGEA